MNRLRTAYYHLATSLWNSPLPMPGADRGDSVSIICFHGVHDEAMTRVAPPPTSSVSAESFAGNVRAVMRTYRIISLTEAVDMLVGRAPWRPKCAVLTFDDSLKCTTEVAFPILARLGVTATVFVSTAVLDGAPPYWWLRLDHAFRCGRTAAVDCTVAGGRRHRVDRRDLESLRRLKSDLRHTPNGHLESSVDAVCEQFGVRLDDPTTQYPYATPMTWDDARRAVASGFSVGSHSVNHPNLALLDPAATRAELGESKRKIEQQLGIACRHFCYPYGYYVAETARIAPACGYEAAVTTDGPGRNRAGVDLFQLFRFPTPTVAPKLAYMLAGARNPFRRTHAKRPPQAAQPG